MKEITVTVKNTGGTMNPEKYQVVNTFTLNDLSLSTPLKINEFTSPNFNMNETNKMFIKTEKVFNETNNILEKSAFNRQILNEMPFPYSNIKAQTIFYLIELPFQ